VKRYENETNFFGKVFTVSPVQTGLVLDLINYAGNEEYKNKLDIEVL